MSAVARPTIFFSGRPLAEWASNVRIRRSLALIPFNLLVEDNSFCGRICYGTHDENYERDAYRMP
jgi:hypothetical protein